MKRQLTALALASCLGLAAEARAQFANLLFQENFDSVIRGPSVNERQGTPSFALQTLPATDATTEPIANAYSHTGPVGWVVDNNFDNFGFTDLTNAGGTPVYDQTTLPTDPPVLLFKLGQTGVVVGNTGVPNQGDAANGADEWEGWSFANKDFWATAAEDQGRTGFTNASGTIAVVDADEFDDLGTGLGGNYMNSGLTTAAIPVAGLSSVTLTYDSSWRAESYDDAHAGLGTASNNQTAIVWATFDTGFQDFIPESLWDSDEGHTSSGPTDPVPTRPASLNFHADATNEQVSYSVAVPAGATSVKFTFGYLNAGNDWWWALDNLAASDGANAPFWTENFDSVALGPSVNERRNLVPTIPRVTTRNDDAATTPYPDAFTHTPPDGWSIDNTGIKAAALGDNNLGVYEWEGWTFADRDFWTPSQGDAAGFTKADGPFAIADSDEFDDFGRNPNNETPNPDYTRPMSTVLTSPELDIAGLAADTLMLKFDSAWRWEGNQSVAVTVDYGSGEVEVLRWDSAENSPNFHDDNLNETVLLNLHNPAGATTAKVSFKYLNGSNNWFWAIDNIAIGTVPEPTGVALCGVALCGLGAARRRRLIAAALGRRRTDA